MIDPGILGPWSCDDVNGNLWSECYLAGALQIRPELIPTVDLSTDHFGDARAREVYASLLQANAEHGDITADVMLSLICDLSGQLSVFALQCQDQVFGFEMLDWHASRVRHGAESRALVELGHDLAKGGEGDLLSAAQERINALEQAEPTKARHHGDVADDVLAELDRPADVIRTGHAAVDRYLGVERGEVVTLGGVPGQGKSLMVGWLVEHWVNQGERILWVSTESGEKQPVRRLAARGSEISTRAFTPGLPEQLKTKLRQVLADQSRWPVWYLGAAYDTGQVCREIRRMRRSRDVSVIVIDHVNELAQPGHPSKREMVEQIWVDLRAAARDGKGTKATLVVVSQVNRQYTQRKDGIPTMGDLRESGVGTQISHLIGIVHRDDKARALVLKIEKNRDGPTGMVVFSFDQEIGQIRGVMTS